MLILNLRKILLLRTHVGHLIGSEPWTQYGLVSLALERVDSLATHVMLLPVAVEVNLLLIWDSPHALVIHLHHLMLIGCTYAGICPVDITTQFTSLLFEFRAYYLADSLLDLVADRLAGSTVWGLALIPAEVKLGLQLRING